MNIHESMMDEFKDEAKMKQLSDEQVEAFIMGSFVFAAVWSLGATTGNDGRKAFDVLFRELIAVRRARLDELHAQHNGWTYIRTYLLHGEEWYCDTVEPLYKGHH